MIRKQRAAKWLEHVKAWHKSGSTQAAYCKINGLHAKNFSNWKRRFSDLFPEDATPSKRMDAASRRRTPFVAVNLTDDSISQSSKSSGIRLSVGEKYHICVSTDFDSSALGRVLTVIAANA